MTGTTRHTAAIDWRRDGAPFTDSRFSRRHYWRFDGGARIVASLSPAMLPEPMADPSGVDPEEALVAAAASCHMLWFLTLAAADGFVVDSYRDEPWGEMGPIGGRRLAFTRIALHPRTAFAGCAPPDAEALRALHDRAGRRCFIANSLIAEVTCEPSFAEAPAGSGP
ncbi:MAG: OsmC family protein [Azospirillaceae bacterium]